MATGKLFVSFWNLCLDNLPLGEFTHRCVSSHEARLSIEQARQEGRLFCVSQNDLIAPYHKRERENHHALCRVLHVQFGIYLSIEDFFIKTNTSYDSLYSIASLDFMQIKDGNRLLVINSSFRLDKVEANKPPVFDIDPSSVEFHVIEPHAASFMPKRPAFQFHALAEHLSA